ncbi:MAG: glycosyltransferase [Actinobacteria bacterium]|nr:glycosyltransferase [Actinomycetota bacterium]
MSRAGRWLTRLTSPTALAIPGYGAALDRVATSGTLPDSVREPLSRDLAAAWSTRGTPERGDDVLIAAARRSTDPAVAAALHSASLARALDRGTSLDDTSIRTAVEQCLTAADLLLDRGDDRVPRLLTAAAVLTFHRQRHLAGLGSPFATPDGVDLELNSYRSSHAWSHLTRPRPSSAVPLTDPPTRIAVLYDDDPRFVAPLVEQWRAEGIDVRVTGVRARATERSVQLPLTIGEQISARWAEPSESAWAALINDCVGDADAVWQEWAQRGAVLASLANLSVPMAVRAHSFELFTVFPHLIDAGSLTGVSTVSAPLAALLRTVLPTWADFPQATIPPTFDPKPFQRPKSSDAPRTLGLVGWAAPDKDVMWALDVLALLRAADPAWRLRLIGAPPDFQRWPEYAHRATERLSRPDVAGAVDIVGATADVAAELQSVGVGLSSSLRESFHLGLAELAASGAVPIVRDWPTLAAYGGAGAVWPTDWVVESSHEAAERARTVIPATLKYLNLPISDTLLGLTGDRQRFWGVWAKKGLPPTR